MSDDYAKFLEGKSQGAIFAGFEPLWMPDFLFPFQKSLTEWAIRKGRSALFEDCGLGKTIQQLVWAQNVVQKTNKPVLVLTPLAVGAQTVREGAKFGIECVQSRDGSIPAKITVTNYQQLHKYNWQDFAGVVCDESAIIKSSEGTTQKNVTRFMSKLQYRLLCTATAAPNDYTELGTSSEALGEIGYSEMIGRFFKQLDNKGQAKEAREQAKNEKLGKHFAKLSFRVSQTIGQYRLKHHAITPFWQWVCSWARACRKPSDLGFSDDGYILPKLNEIDHIITPDKPTDGYLFTIPALGLREERQERRRTLEQRCRFVAELVNHDRPAVIWCHLNPEGDMLEKMIPGAKQIKGSTPDDEKEEIYEDFTNGKIKKLITKSVIAAWGLNWQHCAHVVTFATHSYEQFYQSVRRCWRFGQKSDVRLDVVYTEGEKGVRDNMNRKAHLAQVMFVELIKNMNAAEKIERTNTHTMKMETPIWL